jgi:flagella basal body P-ring formation protein FlgA
MVNNSVKTSTPMTRYLQILCLTVLWHFFGSPSWAAEQDASFTAMSEQVRQWLSQTHQTNPGNIDIAPLDSRIKVQPCTTGLKVDHPFASMDTVRVKCANPVWQLYLQVNLNAQAAQARKTDTKVAMVVPKQLIPRGTPLKPDLLEVISAVPGPGDGSLLSSLKDVEFAEAVRDLRSGEPLHSTDLRRATLVRMGQQVTMILGEKSSFQVMIQLEALQDGRFGEQVRLKNPESGRHVAGVVVGPNQVKGL